MKHWMTAWLLLVGLTNPALATDSLPEKGPRPGEHLQFNIHWMGVPAGRAEMRLERGNDATFEMTASAEAIGAVKLIYPIRDLLTSRAKLAPIGLLSDHYVKDQNGGRKRKYLSYLFDRPDGAVWKVSEQKEKQTRLDLIGNGVNDPLTSFYSVRYYPSLLPGARFETPLLDNDKQYPAIVTVGPAEPLFTPLGWFQTIPIHPIVESSDLFRHEGSMTIWLSDDKLRLPLRVEASLKLSTLAADLVAYDDGQGGHAEIQVKK